ncbi:succinyl-CoA--D-citramalate CoA-transferase [Vulcanimicrobium alpinum]|uniref:Succinyl-CoA--D-citramalate CoA-transferase n=1 Tax=Vulcanimicrobium alpinum TaxID=3016050 RepID=A0AAN2C9U9_UNVUL|nr:CoA transferase [Vulcanimicrobium alpinum]BDE06416.1 succinyl-CoA--D-citramalate CoA-transferase [Vulcanimicrobium alpinum]
MTSYAPPLAGIRVLELGSSVAGPSAGRLLADLGADVLKVESAEGDGLRTWGAPAPDGTSWWFKSHNRNKRFLCFDLHEEADRETVRAIALQCDVLIENFRPGRLEAWGLGYEALRAQHPRLIYASISGYGQDGPYRDRTGFGNIAEAMGGFRYVTGYPDRPPVRVGISLADELAALNLVVGILAALRARDRDGVGDLIDVSLLESCIALTQGQLPEYAALGVVRERQGNRFSAAAPSGVYPTRDGRWIAIGANADSIFRRFAAAIGRPELAADPRFATNRDRSRNIAELEAAIAAWTQSVDAGEAARVLTGAGVPAGPVYSIADIVADEQVRARGVVRYLDDGAGNCVATAAPAARLRAHPAVLDHAARDVGADTDAVLAELGIGGSR